METDRVRDEEQPKQNLDRPTNPSPSEQRAQAADSEMDLEAELMKHGERMLQWFKFLHLPPGLRRTSRIFAVAALQVVSNCPQGPERTVALRKLLEAKDCAVRSQLEVPTDPPVRAGAVR